MKLIDQYLYAVSRYLPEESRKDVGNELRANLEDMLPENYSDEDVRRVLKELGDPRELAYQYNQNKRYLIGPGYYDQYLAVLKMVAGIAALVMGAIVLLSWLVKAPVPVNELDSGAATAVNFIAAFLGAILEGIIQAALWVTIIFVILERSGVALHDQTVKGRAWTPDDLKEIPVSGAEISRPGIIAALLFAIFFIAVLWLRPELVFIFRDTGEGIVRTPFFNTERLAVYLPLLLGVTVLEIGHLSWQYVAGRWTLPLALANAGINGISLITAFLMLRDKALYSNAFISEFAKLFDLTLEQSRANLDRFLLILLAGIVLVTIWDTLEKFRKVRKSNLA